MKVQKATGKINDKGQLILDQLFTTDKNSRVEVIVLISEKLEPDDRNPDHKSQAEVLADFQQSWHEAITGQTIPVAQLWEELEYD